MWVIWESYGGSYGYHMGKFYQGHMEVISWSYGSQMRVIGRSYGGPIWVDMGVIWVDMGVIWGNMGSYVGHIGVLWGGKCAPFFWNLPRDPRPPYFP